MRIFLIGYMGSGKSKTAMALARQLKFPLLDMDRKAGEISGKTISEIFATEGQEHFRLLEKKILIATLAEKNLVVSTGGGTPCFLENMDWMMANGLTIYLEAGEGLLFHRLATNKTGRPLIEKLSDIELMEKINLDLPTRLPFYRRAHLVVSAASLDVKKLLEQIQNFKDAK